MAGSLEARQAGPDGQACLHGAGERTPHVAIGELHEFGRWHIPAVLVDASVVEPVHPFQRGDFDMLGRSPRPAGFDQLGLLRAADRLRQGVVVARSGSPDRCIDSDLNEPVGERN